MHMVTALKRPHLCYLSRVNEYFTNKVHTIANLQHRILMYNFFMQLSISFRLQRRVGVQQNPLHSPQEQEVSHAIRNIKVP